MSRARFEISKARGSELRFKVDRSVGLRVDVSAVGPGAGADAGPDTRIEYKYGCKGSRLVQSRVVRIG